MRSAGILLVSAIAAAALTKCVAPDRQVVGGDEFYGMVVGLQVDVERAIPKPFHRWASPASRSPSARSYGPFYDKRTSHV